MWVYSATFKQSTVVRPLFFARSVISLAAAMLTLGLGATPPPRLSEVILYWLPPDYPQSSF